MLPRLRKKLSRKALIELLQSYLPGLEFTKEIDTRFLRMTHNSSLYLVSSPSFQESLLIKQVRTNDVEAQYGALVSAYEKMNDNRYCVPRPIACVPGKSVIIMEFIDSNRVDNILLRKDVSGAEKIKCLEGSGQWLSNFHASFRLGIEVFDTQKKMAELSEQRVATEPAFSKHLEMVSVFHWLESTAPYIQTRRTAFGYTHGDFKQENILCSDGSFYGIDLLLEEKGNQLMDVVQFINHLVFLTVTHVGNSYSKYVNEWISCFLDSYAEDQPMVDMEILYWLRLQHLMRYWAMEMASKNPLSIIQANKLEKEISTLFYPKRVASNPQSWSVRLNAGSSQ
jgi:tRNA A-37 threonylcarbamoyl transferase component Bud32